MPRAVATYEAVKQAAVTLLARGELPTLERLRALVGHGSFTTIRQHYQRLQQELREQPKAQWPSTVPATLVSGLEQLWHTAMEAAEEQYQALKSEAVARIGAAEQQIQDFQQTLTQTQQQVDTLEQKQATAREQIQTLEKALAVAQDRLATRTAALEDWQKQAGEAQQAVAAARAEVEQERNRASQAEIHLAERTQELNAQGQEVDRLLQQLAGGEKERQTVCRHLAEAEQRLADAEHRIAAIEQAGVKQLAEWEKKLQVIAADRDQESQRREALERKLTAAEMSRAAAEREVEVLERNLDALAYRFAQGGEKPPTPPPGNPILPLDPVEWSRAPKCSVAAAYLIVSAAG